MGRYSNQQPATRAFARVLRWLIGLLVIGNLLAYIVRTQFGPLGELFDSDSDSEQGPSGGASSAMAGRPAIAGIAQLPATLNATEGQFPPGAGNFKPGELCWYLSAGFAVDASAQPNANNGDSPGESGEERRLKTIQARLAALDIASQLVTVDVVDAVQYMVVMGDVAANATVDTLKWLLARNYNAFVVQLDGQVQAVALDIFPTDREANAAATAFAGDGLVVEVLVHTEREQQARLMLSEGEYSKLARRVWSTLRSDFPGIGKEKKYCQSIAPLTELN